MGKSLDLVPLSAIVRIRDMMYTVKDPFRLDQGDVSFDAPDTFKQAVAKAIAAEVSLSPDEVARYLFRRVVAWVCHVQHRRSSYLSAQRSEVCSVARSSRLRRGSLRALIRS